MAKTDDQVLKTAAQCRHYAMCKIDYLGTGLCPPGKRYHYVSYYPQGRMDLYAALAANLIPVTAGLVDIAETCTLCGVCELQCHFVTGLRPLQVMKALKDRVDNYLKAGGKPEVIEADEALRRLREIVGAEWATNDPAVLITYANDPFPLANMKMPRYVVLPGSREEVAAVVRLANELGLPYVVRGNGGSVFGFVFSDGIVFDMQRMRRIAVDEDNWSAAVGPGVTSFELQQEVSRQGLRVNTAEPAATVCGNIVCTGTFSTWSNVYGTAADGFIDMEFVDAAGNIFRLNDKKSPNVFAFENAVIPAPGICTEALVKLQPTSEDEDGLLVPFWDFDEAVSFVRELGRRRIGLAVAVLGIHYIASFMSPSKALTDRLKEVLPETLGIRYVVFAIGDRFARDSIRKMAGPVIDSDLWRALVLGLPRLLDREWLELVKGFEAGRPPYEFICRPEIRPLIETVLRPSAQTIAGAIEEDLRESYVELYARPRLTDMAWLNMFRVLSSRMSRNKHMFAFLVYVPIDKHDVINHINAEFARIATDHDLDHDFGFLTPLDLGKRAILEYDYYIDHTDPAEREKIGRAMVEIGPWLDRLAERTKGVTFLKYVFSQGCSRKENFLYR
ncbi:MAG: FAD-binding oxidoreductase [Candidatus Aminicenantales bacterium]